jgi:hypothetical protein
VSDGQLDPTRPDIAPVLRAEPGGPGQWQRSLQHGKTAALVEAAGGVDADLVLVVAPGHLGDRIAARWSSTRDVRVTRLCPDDVVYGYRPEDVPEWAGGPPAGVEAP